MFYLISKEYRFLKYHILTLSLSHPSLTLVSSLQIPWWVKYIFIYLYIFIIYIFIYLFIYIYIYLFIQAFLVAQSVKNLSAVWETHSIPRLGRSPGKGKGYPLQCSCLENPMDRGATVHGVAKRQIQLSD